jgi:hypothetical protein
MDLFELGGKTFIVMVDYYSRWVEMRHLDSQTSANTIAKIKSIFAVHGIPDVVISDNGPQFASAEFKSFAANYDFNHTTSSPKYPQSNGEAERAVQTVKQMLRKSKDPYAALLLYRATPLRNGLSPSELLMGRKLKTKLPMLPSTLIPKTQNHSMIQEKETNLKQQQRDNYNQRHMAREAPPLKAGDTVFIKDMAKPGQVVAKHHNPRSYIIRTEHGNIRRNASHLVATPTAPMGQQQAARDTPQQDPANMTTTLQREPATITTQQPTPRSLPATTHTTAAPGTPCAIRTKSGRYIKKPERLDL